MLSASLETLKSIVDKKTGGDLLLPQAKAAVLASETIVTAFAAFAESVTKTPDDKSPPLLLKAAFRRLIRETSITHLLSLKILSGGGDGVTTQKRLWESGRMIFIAGCAISYILVKTDGTYVLADTHHGLAHLNYKLGKPEQSLKVRIIETETLGSKP